MSSVRAEMLPRYLFDRKPLDNLEGQDFLTRAVCAMFGCASCLLAVTKSVSGSQEVGR